LDSGEAQRIADRVERGQSEQDRQEPHSAAASDSEFIHNIFLSLTSRIPSTKHIIFGGLN